MVYCTSGGLLAAALLLIIGAQQGSTLKCWTCSSQTDYHCNEPFNKTENIYAGNVRLLDCDNERMQASYSSYSRAVCLKQKQKMRSGQVITLRRCDWTNDNDGRTKGECGNPSLQSDAKMEFCETCSTDGCNGSPKNMLPPIWSSMVPLAIFTFYKKYNM